MLCLPPPNASNRTTGAGDSGSFSLPQYYDTTSCTWLYYDPSRCINNVGQSTLIIAFIQFWRKYLKGGCWNAYSLATDGMERYSRGRCLLFPSLWIVLSFLPLASITQWDGSQRKSTHTPSTHNTTTYSSTFTS
jgi:hypothetical protein